MKKLHQRPRALFVLSVAALFVLSAPPYHLSAAEGDLDPSFGSGGKVTTDFFGITDEAAALAVQSDGKIIAAGYALQPGTPYAVSDFALARYDSTGALDPTFGSGGKVTTDFSGQEDVALAVVLQSDGKIIAAGSSGGDFALARYDSTGALDPTFGSGGKVTTDFSGGGDGGAAVALQSDGKIIVAGVTNPSGTDFNFALARYDSTGALDPSFGSGGKVTTDFAGGYDEASAVAVQSDGKIVVGGSSHPGPDTGSDFAVARYDSTGALDPSFGSGGKVTTDFSFLDFAYSMTLQSDGKIILAGSTGGPISGFSTVIDFALARYDGTGALDPSFGSGGKVTTEFTGYLSEAHAVVVQSDGKIVVAGVAADLTADADFALARYDSAGNLDSSFGSLGKVMTDFSGLDDFAYAAAIQSDGKILAAGTSGGNFGLARYDGPPSVTAQIASLISEISSSSLPEGTKTSLIAKLQAGLAALQLGDNATACSKLEDFLNYVRAQREKKIPAAVADSFTNTVTQIRTALGC